MNQTDLEIYRWKLHNRFVNKSPPSPISSAHEYWGEYGAFVSIMPRQSGKSTMIKRMIDILADDGESDVVVIAVNNTHKAYLVNNIGIAEDIIGCADSYDYGPVGSKGSCHLFVDEFMYIGNVQYKNLNWKTMTLVGSLR